MFLQISVRSATMEKMRDVIAAVLQRGQQFRRHFNNWYIHTSLAQRTHPAVPTTFASSHIMRRLHSSGATKQAVTWLIAQWAVMYFVIAFNQMVRACWEITLGPITRNSFETLRKDRMLLLLLQFSLRYSWKYVFAIRSNVKVKFDTKSTNFKWAKISIIFHDTYVLTVTKSNTRAFV